METEPVDVIASADANVALPLTVLAASLADIAPPTEATRLTVLTSPDAPAAMVESARRAAGPQVTVRCVEVPDELVRGAPGRHLSTAAYYLLFAADLLDSARVIYIDLDVVVLEPLGHLWSIDLHGRPLAAVQNLTIPFVASKNGVVSWRERHLEPRLPYFNGGVLIVDLDQWRRDRHGEAVIEIARQGHEHFVNQGSLNAHFAGRWTRLPLRWNQHSSIYAKESGHESVFDLDELEAARKDPAIVHFIGPTKPWHRVCTHPYAEHWRAIAQRVGPPGWKPARNESRRQIAKRRLAKAWLALREG